jgi:hypothetical protein
LAPDGNLLRVIGKAGDGAQLGLYDELKMQKPLGLAIDDNNQLWVAEATHLPKRISRWDAGTGAFKRANYGPPRYGGGGTIDPNRQDADVLRRLVRHDGVRPGLENRNIQARAICVNGWSGGTDPVAKFGIEYGSGSARRPKPLGLCE